MKKILNSMILGLGAVLALVGCGGGTSNGSDGDSAVTYPDAITEWKSADVTIMNTLLGRVLPVAPFSANYESATFDDESAGTVIYFSDETIEDRSEAYGATLVAAGYEYQTTLTDSGYSAYFYYFEIENDGVYDYIGVQVDYFPGNTSYAACFEVYAWYEVGAPAAEEFEEWPAEALAEALGTTETLPSFEAELYLLSYDPDYDSHDLYGFTEDTEIEATYTTTLEGAGWTIDDTQYDDYGYFAESLGGELSIQYFYDAEDSLFVVYIWVISVDDTPVE